MSSEEKDVDLPVDYSVWKCPVCGTVRQTEVEMIQHLGRKDQHHERPVEIELVKRQDAEAAIAKERSRKYDQGFFEGRQSREKEILNKIEGMKQDVSGARLHSADVKEALTNLQDELEEETDQS
jgi:hypothetical protein